MINSDQLHDALLSSGFKEARTSDLLSEYNSGLVTIYLKKKGKKVPPGLVFDSEFHDFHSLIMRMEGVVFRGGYYKHPFLEQFPIRGENTQGRPTGSGYHVAFDNDLALRLFLNSLTLYSKEGVDAARTQLDGVICDDDKTVRSAVANQRVGQSKFRLALDSYWQRCAVLPIARKEFLRASHIKPWKDSNDLERLDAFNGLLLSSNLDIAFDNGLVSFQEDGEILISPLLSEDEGMALGIHEAMKLYKVHKKHEPYLDWHRKHIFKVTA